LSRGIRKAAVFPVPFFALAIRLFRYWMIGIDYYWIGVGTVYPFSVSPKISSSLSFNSLKDLYLVGLISFVSEKRILWSVLSNPS
jgi:hypothetical protein